MSEFKQYQPYRSFPPFQIQFDKPTYLNLKEMAVGFSIKSTAMVLICVRFLWAISKNRNLLTDEGKAELKRIIALVKGSAEHT
jgi:hypothetical protein